MSTLILSLLLACGPKKAPEAAAAQEPPPQPAAAAEPEPEPEPEPAAPADVTNADLRVTITRGDGSTQNGHVKRVERSEDWFGEQGWSTEVKDLVITGENATGMKSIKWADVSEIAITPGKVPADVDCFYDSDWSPWMYDCTLKTTTKVKLKDGSLWDVTNRHKWKLTFDDGTAVEFWLFKHPAREQDDQVVTLDTVNPENYDLYTRLQQRLRDESTGSMVTKVKVQ